MVLQYTGLCDILQADPGLRRLQWCKAGVCLPLEYYIEVIGEVK